MAGEERATTQRDLVQRLFLEQIVSLRRFVAALVTDTDLVNDVVQDAFVEATARAEEYAATSDFVAWLETIAQKKITQASWKASAGGKPFADDVLDLLRSAHQGEANQVDRSRLVEECVQSLAPTARRIVELRYRNGMKPREVAKLLGWTGPSVHVALSRARAAIKRCLDLKLSTTT